MKLAINGGSKVRNDLFPDQNTMGMEEAQALLRVVNAGRPSGYRANRGPHFAGGPEIQALEKEWSTKFKAMEGSSVACNSATSGLFIACAAIGLKPGDEVIVTPYSMTCSATIPLWFGATPVFADVEQYEFCLDPLDVEHRKLINSKTKAIIAVDIFGQPANYDYFKELIHEAEIKYGHKIYLISDTAQAPWSKYKGKFSGTIADIGVFSLNFGKHMTCGEGGMIICQDSELNMRCRLSMNHAESVINDYSQTSTIPVSKIGMIGLNLRMTEFQAAVAREQLKKLEWNAGIRCANAQYLDELLSEIPAIKVPPSRIFCTHSFYVAPYLWDESLSNIKRNVFIEAVKAELTPRKGRDGEGVQIGCGYITPIYLMPWRSKQPPISLPIVENLWKNTLFLTLLHAPNSTTEDMDDVCKAFQKVWKYQGELK